MTASKISLGVLGKGDFEKKKTNNKVSKRWCMDSNFESLALDYLCTLVSGNTKLCIYTCI